MRISKSGDLLVRDSSRKHDPPFHGRDHAPKTLRYGGDERVDRNGISTENHLEMWRRLAVAGRTMHGTPGPRKPHKS